MKYKGIEGQYHYNPEMKKLVGELKNVNGLWTFTGSSPKDIQIKFRNTVESYLSSLKKEADEDGFV